MLQGVHELYELNETPQLWEENSRINRLVFIGKETHGTQIVQLQCTCTKCASIKVLDIHKNIVSMYTFTMTKMFFF